MCPVGTDLFFYSLWIHTMNRCRSLSGSLSGYFFRSFFSPCLGARSLQAGVLAVMVAAGGLAALAPSTAAAQLQVQRPFPQNALRGEVVFGQPPELKLNGQAARLAPGARIRGTDNLLVMSGALAGTKATVHYTTDIYGQLLEVWLLRPDELAKKVWPKTAAEAAAWTFDPAGQFWTKN